MNSRLLVTVLAFVCLVLLGTVKAQAAVFPGGTPPGLPPHYVLNHGTITLPPCDPGQTLTTAVVSTSLTGNIQFNLPVAGQCGAVGLTPQVIKILVTQPAGGSYTCALATTDGTPIHPIEQGLAVIPSNFCVVSNGINTPTTTIYVDWNPTNQLWEVYWSTDPSQPIGAGFVYPPAAADARVFFNGSMANGSTVLTDTVDAPWVPTDVGKVICVGSISGTYGPSAFTAFGPLPQSEKCGYIVTYTSPSQVILSFSSSAGAAVTTATFRYGTDNTAVIQATVNSCVPQGCTIALIGAYAVTNTIYIPPTVSINIQGVASYAPDANYNNGHLLGTGSGLWFLTTSMSTPGLVYGVSGTPVQNVLDELSHVQLIAGSGANPCPTPHNSACDGQGYFGTLAGGGGDGIDVLDMQHVTLRHVSISNFKGDCFKTAAGNDEFTNIYDSYFNYCGANGIEYVASLYNAQSLLMTSDIEDMGLNGVYYHPADGLIDGNDGFTVINNTIQANNVTSQSNIFNLNIATGRDHIVLGNHFEGGGFSVQNCFNSGGGNAFGPGSQLWIGNSQDSPNSANTTCENIQFSANTAQNGAGPPVCNANFLGSTQWVTNCTGTPAAPTYTYHAAYPGTVGTAQCKIMCTTTGTSTYGWRYN